MRFVRKTRLHMSRMRLFAAFILAVFLAATAVAEETIVLRTGEQYRCTIESTADGRLSCIVDGETRSFALEDVQRIDFEREREFGEIDSAEALAAAAPFFAEALGVDTETLRAEYPQAGLVMLRNEVEVDVRSGGAYTIERLSVWHILEQRAADSAVKSLYYIPGMEKQEVVFAITVAPDGEVAHISDAGMKDEAVYPSQPEYDYLRRVRFTMKNPSPGATLFLKTRTEGTATVRRPLVIDRAFRSDEPAVYKSVRLTGDAAALENAAIVTTGGLEACEERHWVVEDSPQIFWESLMPPVRDFAPRLVIAYPKTDWASAAAALPHGFKTGPSINVEAETPGEIFETWDRYVRTIDVPLDSLPGAPAAPGDVLDRGYGTVLEKSLLLKYLLEREGFDASVVIVRGKDQGALIKSVPRLRGFNAAVVRATDRDGKVTWFQCDGARRAPGELSGSVQGGDGLDLRSGEIVTVPLRDAADESVVRTTEVDLAADGSATVKHSFRFAGLAATGMRGLADLSDVELRKWAESNYGGSLPGAELVEFTHSDFEKPDAVETIQCAVRAPYLANTAGDYLIMSLPSARYSPSDFGRSAREFDLSWSTRDSETLLVVITPPKGYRAYALSPGTALSGEGWSLAASFDETKDGAVTYSETWRRDVVDAPRDSYDAIRRAEITRGLLRDRQIVFVKRADAKPAVTDENESSEP